jgi:glycosyltransferase involved in cell wall biosynthesis
MSLRVSVVVPVYCGARHLAQTLQAVAAQQHRPHEVIVVDDGSPDNSAEVAETTAAQCGLPLQLLRQPQAGVAAARNAGWALASGDAVCFLDQDDIWHPEHLARQVRVLTERPEIDVVVNPYLHWFASAKGHRDPALLWPVPEPVYLDADYTGWVYHQFLRDCWALTSATLLRRSLLQASGGFDVTLPFSEDWDLWLRLSHEHRFALLNWPPVLYRQHSVQGSRHVRDTDFRCQLLLAQAARHGRASRDGRALSAGEFQCLIARYELAFGYHHLQHGSRALALRTLWRAWRRRPLAPRALGLALAGALGWRPQPGALGQKHDGPAVQ